MYWHYIYKFLFALYRYYTITLDQTILQLAVTIIQDIHPFFYLPHQGIRWKINVDGSPIDGPQSVSSTDNQSAYVMYTLINKATPNTLQKELRELSSIVMQELQHPEHIRFSVDPLNLGETAFLYQWLDGPSMNQLKVILKQTMYEMQISKPLQIP